MPDILSAVDPARRPFSHSATDLHRAQQSFLSVLGKRTEPQLATPEQMARESAAQLVSLTLVQPLLKQLRETSNAAPPFAPTQAEKQFRALTDADLAQQIVHAKQFPLVDRLARDLLKRGGRLESGLTVEQELAGVPASTMPTMPRPAPMLKVNP